MAAIPATTTIRVARPTNDLDACVRFYRDALGLAELGGFVDHDGYDGVMLGVAGAPWHLELTRERGHVAPPAPSTEHLLVLYVPDEDTWRAVVARMSAHGCAPVPSSNPYWDRDGRGVTFADPDGYRVVLYRGRWPAD